MTVIVPIRDGAQDALTLALKRIGTDIVGNDLLRFPDFEQIHFCRFVIVPPAKGCSSGYQLAFGTDHDGDDETLLRALATRAMPGLETIYQYCVGWPGPDSRDAVVRYLLEQRIPYAARHIACRRRSVGDLRAAVDAHRWMADYANDHAPRPRLETSPQTAATATPTPTPTEIAAAARHAGVAYPLPGPVSDTPAYLKVGAVAVAGAAAVGAGLYLIAKRSPAAAVVTGAAVAVGPIAYFLTRLRAEEKADTAAWTRAEPPSLEKLATLRTWEDHQVQNQMTHVVPLRPGSFRQKTLRNVFRVIDFLAAHFWNKGKLGDIPTIHFARWMLIDNGTRLLFFSNYDGSWENYLGDFIDRAAVGLTGVWSNTEGFPPTTYLIQGGARNAEAFKNWTRRHQIETQVWYTAYPDVTAVNQLDAVALQVEPPDTPGWIDRL